MRKGEERAAPERGEAIVLPPQERGNGTVVEVTVIPIKSARSGQIVRYVVHSKKLLEGGVGGT